MLPIKGGGERPLLYIHMLSTSSKAPTDPTLNIDIFNLKLLPPHHRYSLEKATLFIDKLKKKKKKTKKNLFTHLAHAITEKWP